MTNTLIDRSISLIMLKELNEGRINMAKQAAPVKKNEYIDLQFVDLTHEGNGVGKIANLSLLSQYFTQSYSTTNSQFFNMIC